MTEPYYRDSRVTIYHGDALTVMPGLAAGTAHAVVTDPPYIIGAVSNGALGSKSGGWIDMMNSAGRRELIAKRLAQNVLDFGSAS